MSAFSGRSWPSSFFATGILSAIARYDLFAHHRKSSIELLLIWPGWLASVYFVYISPHGDDIGHGWDFVVAMIAGGAIWGSLIFALWGIAGLAARREA